MRKVRDAALALTGLQPPGRRLRVRPTDTFLTSYPRSGNTWLRVIVTSLARPGEFLDGPLVRAAVPDIYKEKARVLESATSPRILKSHEYFDPRYPRVLYLVRDPRDVAVSYFHFLTGIDALERGTTVETFGERFVSGLGDGWGTWGEHVQSWIATREGSERFLLVRYEDLRSAPADEVSRIAKFLGLERTSDEVEGAIEAASFHRMRGMSLGPSTKSEQDPALMTRRGAVESWREELPASSARTIEDAFGPVMSSLGYQGS